MAAMRLSRIRFGVVRGWAAALPSTAAGLAQADAPRSADHRVQSRYPNSRVAEDEENYNAVEMMKDGAPGTQPKHTTIEGRVTRTRHFSQRPEESRERIASVAELPERREKRLQQGDVPAVAAATAARQCWKPALETRECA